MNTKELNKYLQKYPNRQADDLLGKRLQNKLYKILDDLDQCMCEIHSKFPEAQLIAETDSLTLYLGARNSEEFEEWGYGRIVYDVHSHLEVVSYIVAGLDIQM